MSNLLYKIDSNNNIGIGTNIIEINDSLLFKNEHGSNDNIMEINNNLIQLNKTTNISNLQLSNPLSILNGGTGLNLGNSYNNKILKTNTGSDRLDPIDPNTIFNLDTKNNIGTNENDILTLGHISRNVNINASNLQINLNNNQNHGNIEQMLIYKNNSLQFTESINFRLDSMWKLMEFLHPRFILLLHSVTIDNDITLTPSFVPTTNNYVLNIPSSGNILFDAEVYNNSLSKFTITYDNNQTTITIPKTNNKYKIDGLINGGKINIIVEAKGQVTDLQNIYTFTINKEIQSSDNSVTIF